VPRAQPAVHLPPPPPPLPTTTTRTTPCAWSGDMRLFRDEVRGVTVYQVTVPLLPAGAEGAAAAAWLETRSHAGSAPPVPTCLASVKGADATTLEALAERQQCEVVGLGSTKAADLASTALPAAASVTSAATGVSPLHVHAAPPLADCRAGGRLPAAPDGSTLGLHVLAVDDERSNRLIMKRMLDRLGCTCVVVTEGDEAITELQRTGQAGAPLGMAVPRGLEGARPFDVVLMDVVMKRTDGVSTLLTMRDRLGVTVPIIATSGNRPQSGDMIGPSRFNVFLQKPFTVQELAAVLTPIALHLNAATAARVEDVAVVAGGVGAITPVLTPVSAGAGSACVDGSGTVEAGSSGSDSGSDSGGEVAVHPASPGGGPTPP
jgi:CheY-like chemotaxis protein